MQTLGEAVLGGWPVAGARIRSCAVGLRDAHVCVASALAYANGRAAWRALAQRSRALRRCFRWAWPGLRWVFLVVAVCGVAGPSAAQVAQSPQYLALIEQALREHEAANFAEARALFLKAHALYPNARTLRGIGMMEFELRNYPDSIARLQAALASRVNPIEGELRRATEQLLARARGFVVPLQLSVRPVRSATSVRIDGVVAAWDRERTLHLTVGEHTLEVSAPGFENERRALSVKGGEAQAVSVVLRAIEPPRAAPLSATQPVSPRDDDASLWSSPWLWVGVSAALIGGAVATTLLLTQDSRPSLERGDVGTDGLVTTLRGAR